jgi:uncharacterized protein (TIGR02646 family)
MRKLDRSPDDTPTCLTSYDFRTQSWNDLEPACKASIVTSLYRMQGTPADPGNPGREIGDFIGVRCAYCEGHIRHEAHIEHFRRKSRSHPNGYPELTFAWENLFLSCGSKTHCGHYKDNGCRAEHEAEDLIKPDEHDPDDYLYFHSTGDVLEQNNGSGMTEAERRRARGTIRVFNLRSPALQAARARAVQIYKLRDRGVFEALQSWSPEDRRAYVQLELEATRWDAHSTVIKHLLQRCLD